MAQNPLGPPPLVKQESAFDRWMRLMYQRIIATGQILWSQISFTGSNLTDIATRNHADLQNLNTASYTHLSSTHASGLTGGGLTTLHKHYTAVPYDAGTQSSGTFTPDEANGNFQYCTNGGAHTLAPPTNSCTLIIQITNNSSAGTITTSGFTKVTGTAPTTTDGDDFIAYITKVNGFSHLQWQELQ